MATSLQFSAWRGRFRDSLGRSEGVLRLFRMARYGLLQGPWRPWVIRHFQTHNRNAPLPTCADTLFADLDLAGTVQRLNDDAYAPGFQVPQEIIAQIRAYSREAGVKRVDEPHVDCEPVRRLAYDPRIAEVARRYLEAEPILCTSKLYWTVPPADERGRRQVAEDGGLFHYDLSDVKSLTVFAYMTDVDAECGPHVVIRGSQERRTPAQIFRRFIADEEADRIYGSRIEMILGKQGTAWFEDIACYHKQEPGSRPRLMLSFTYSLHRRPLSDDPNRVASSRGRGDGTAYSPRRARA